MGFIKAFAGAVGGAFADQWKDMFVPIDGVPATAAIFPAVMKGTNNNRGSNTKGSENIITNGSKIVVSEDPYSKEIKTLEKKLNKDKK